MIKNIAVIRGDGIGPEIVNEALLVLNRIAELYGHAFHYTDVDMAAAPSNKWGDPLPPKCSKSAYIPTACCWAQ